ncbi:MAG: HAMP domain-containing histidine kinase, partial [Flammeovirgaceae bacterium]|nr:HAMP domain-containing histidine kinase [Flammeovirgaceae bacterium]
FTDNGIGIAEEYVEKIFRMFFRANADSKGSGLGLYIVKGVVEKLKGTLSVQSTLGEGTSFVFRNS